MRNENLSLPWLEAGSLFGEGAGFHGFGQETDAFFLFLDLPDLRWQVGSLPSCHVRHTHTQEHKNECIALVLITGTKCPSMGEYRSAT